MRKRQLLIPIVFISLVISSIIVYETIYVTNKEAMIESDFEKVVQTSIMPNLPQAISYQIEGDSFEKVEIHAT
ncbi:hypothetical protein, partial [Paenibacillus tundrae]|uniref:hypothetical protein n=1 Tax=Paenibacillus tundrae TaxID=528187 RepID=UPI0022A9DCB3